MLVRRETIYRYGENGRYKTFPQVETAIENDIGRWIDKHIGNETNILKVKRLLLEALMHDKHNLFYYLESYRDLESLIEQERDDD